MKEYHKIPTVFKRDPETNFSTLLHGVYATLEFQYLADNEWEFTEKVDGTNIRVSYNGEGIAFGGKTDRAQIPGPLMTSLAMHFLPRLETFQSLWGGEVDVVLYGEGYGAKIQKGGGNYGADQKFVLFDVLVNTWWLRRNDVEDVAKQLSIDVVPVVGHGTLHEMVNKVRDGFLSHWGCFTAEGIVARPIVPLMARDGSRIITKLKHKDFRQ